MSEVSVFFWVMLMVLRDECPVLMLQFIITRPGRHQTEWKNGAAPFQGVYIPGLKMLEHSHVVRHDSGVLQILFRIIKFWIGSSRIFLFPLRSGCDIVHFISLHASS
ncbi:uncharacterized protein LOC110835209 [Zootermopsis nevadensis]|uniref:uncharacterized protein LOC110835209 n=1 Tax=Zootermopsis nevadensis TaxID=136037 RepID=UPI000B8EA31D|nr:uncharacterized protein LOC110835209 [Zootermopsis nevadensis]